MLKNLFYLTPNRQEYIHKIVKILNLFIVIGDRARMQRMKIITSVVEVTSRSRLVQI